MKTTKSHELKSKSKGKNKTTVRNECSQNETRKYTFYKVLSSLVLGESDNLVREEPTPQASDPKKLTSLPPSCTLPFPTSTNVYYARC